MYIFHTAKELLTLCKNEEISISEVVIRREVEKGSNRTSIFEKMSKSWEVAKKAIKNGLENQKLSVGKMVQDEAKIYNEYFKSGKGILSPMCQKAVIYAIANNICNACMGKIVATPTAGSSGILPGVLLASSEEIGLSDDDILKGFFTAAGIGIIIAENATMSGAQGGCQAEIGSSTAMTAAALTELRGGTPETCFQAAALALKNLLGLACDPVGGLVEVPCVKRNGFGATHAITASEMALAGIKSVIPFDEVVIAMENIGKLISPKLRETALGGLAITETAKKIEVDLGLSNGRKNEEE